MLGLCEAQRLGIAADLPRKLAKAEKPVRRGVVWLAARGAQVLVERRPDRGLLGGMLGFVGDGWDGAGGGAPFAADWQDLGEVKHTFTHFHLILQVRRAEAPADRRANPERGEYREVNPGDLPTVMRKAHDLAFAGKVPR